MEKGQTMSATATEGVEVLRDLLRRSRAWIGSVEHDVPGQPAREDLLAELDAALGVGDREPTIDEWSGYVDLRAGESFGAGDEMRSSICGEGNWVSVPSWWVSVGLVYQPGVHPRCRRPVEGGVR